MTTFSFIKIPQVFILFCLVWLGSCKLPLDKSQGEPRTSVSLHLLNNELVNVLVKDRFSPPIASRIHAYTNLGFHEAIIGYQQDKSFKKLLADFPEIDPLPKGTHLDLCAELVFINIAWELTYSKREWENLRKQIQEKAGLDSLDFAKHQGQADEFSQKILKWASKDGFKERLRFEQYSVQDDPSLYQLTPPAYNAPIEPYWGTLRPFIIKEPNAYSCIYDYQYAQGNNSDFFIKNKELHQLSKGITKEQVETALFWDCNPVQLQRFGHAMRYSFRMTPSSHWICILNRIAKEQDIPNKKSSLIYTTLSLAMADAFIACWNDKYKYNTVRPVTFIRSHIEESWLPALETPSFPEYPSGHSSVSAAAAAVLEGFFGNNFHFSDDSQARFGAAERKFPSFKAAADEAGVSRVYGGIHYQISIGDGFQQGTKIGDKVWRSIKSLR